MKKYVTLAALLALAVPLSGQTVGLRRVVTLAADYDLDGAAADNDVIVAAVDIEDDKDDYTIAAQPDTPRPLEIVIVDADDSTTCTATVTGTLADGTVVSASVEFDDDDAAWALSPNYNFATVTSLATGTCTGEAAGDTIQLGTTSTIPTVYFLPWGSESLTSQGVRRKDPFAWKTERREVETSGSSTTVTSVTASSGALENVDVGDIVRFVVTGSGEVYERVVVTNADDDTITIDEALDLSADGYAYSYRTLLRSPEDDDGVIPVAGFDSAAFVFLLHQAGNDIDTRVQCRVGGAGSGWVTVSDEAQSASATLVTEVVTVDLSATPYDECRAGLQFATSDADGDAAAELEIVTIQFVGVVGGR